MFEIGNVLFILELLIAETILLYSCPRRKDFAMRTASVFVGCTLLAYFFPSVSIADKYLFQGYQLLRFFVMFAYTVGGMAICYDISWRTVLSLCAAGYAVQHLSYQIFTLLSSIPFIKMINLSFFDVFSWVEIFVFILIYVLTWLFFGRKIEENEYYKNSDVRLDVLSVSLVFICIVLTRVSYVLSGYGDLSPRIYAVVCCVMALIIQFNLYSALSERYEKEVVYQLWKEERKQYDLSKKMMDTINVKCHDLKYKLREHNDKLSKEERKSLEKIVNIYDGMVKTGNEVLDVILSENHLQCQEHDIKFSFMGNGEALSFITPSDMYSLFGNALDNAREAVIQLPKEKRIVSLTITKKGEFVNIDLVNYFNGELNYEEGEIVTSKTEGKEYHGFGIKSMQMLAKKYSGDLRVSITKDTFNLGIYLIVSDPNATSDD